MGLIGTDMPRNGLLPHGAPRSASGLPGPPRAPTRLARRPHGRRHSLQPASPLGAARQSRSPQPAAAMASVAAVGAATLRSCSVLLPPGNSDRAAWVPEDTSVPDTELSGLRAAPRAGAEGHGEAMDPGLAGPPRRGALQGTSVSCRPSASYMLSARSNPACWAMSRLLPAKNYYLQGEKLGEDRFYALLLLRSALCDAPKTSSSLWLNSRFCKGEFLGRLERVCAWAVH